MHLSLNLEIKILKELYVVFRRLTVVERKQKYLGTHAKLYHGKANFHLKGLPQTVD